MSGLFYGNDDEKGLPLRPGIGTLERDFHGAIRPPGISVGPLEQLQGPPGETGPQGVSIEAYFYSMTNVLRTQVGQNRVYLEGNYAVESVRASVGTAPIGSSVIVDVKANGTSLYAPTNRPTITAGSFTGTGGTLLASTLTTGNYLTVDVAAIGSTFAGADLTVAVRLRRIT